MYVGIIWHCTKISKQSHLLISVPIIYRKIGLSIKKKIDISIFYKYLKQIFKLSSWKFHKILTFSRAKLPSRKVILNSKLHCYKSFMTTISHLLALKLWILYNYIFFGLFKLHIFSSDFDLKNAIIWYINFSFTVLYLPLIPWKLLYKSNIMVSFLSLS